MKSITQSRETNRPLVLPTNAKNPFAKLIIRGELGQVVQQWLILQNKCTIGSASTCAVRCELPGIAPYHALLVVGAKQTFIRALAPKLTRSGQAVNELLLTEVENQFEIAGHKFELLRGANTTSRPASQVAANSRMKFTLARPFELSRPRQSATPPIQPPVSVEPVWVGDDAAELNARWIAELIQSAIQPLENKLMTIVEPLSAFHSELQKNQAELHKEQSANSQNKQSDGNLTPKRRRLPKLSRQILRSKSLPPVGPISPAASDAQPPVPPTSSAATPNVEAERPIPIAIEVLFAKQAASLDILSERLADVNSQLNALERIVADNIAATNENLPPPTPSNQAAIDRLQETTEQLGHLLRDLQARQSDVERTDDSWRSEIREQIGQLQQSIARATPTPTTSSTSPIAAPAALKPDFSLPLVAPAAPKVSVPEASIPLEQATTELAQRELVQPEEAQGKVAQSEEAQSEEAQPELDQWAGARPEEVQPMLDQSASADVEAIAIAEVVPIVVAPGVLPGFTPATSVPTETPSPSDEWKFEHGNAIHQAPHEGFDSPVKDSWFSQPATVETQDEWEGATANYPSWLAEEVIDVEPKLAVKDTAVPHAPASTATALPAWWTDDERALEQPAAVGNLPPLVHSPVAEDSAALLNLQTQQKDWRPQDQPADENGEHNPSAWIVGDAESASLSSFGSTPESTWLADSEPLDNSPGELELAPNDLDDLELDSEDAQQIASLFHMFGSAEPIDKIAADNLEASELASNDDQQNAFDLGYRQPDEPMAAHDAVVSTLQPLTEEPERDAEIDAATVSQFSGNEAEVRQPVAPLYRLPEAEAVSNQPETIQEEASAIPEEESVEDYMTRLLARMRTSEEPSPAITSRKPVKEVSQQVNASPNTAGTQIVSTSAPAAALPETVRSVSVATKPFNPEEYIPRALAPEKSQNLAALRELANNSARSAIQVSARRKYGSALAIKLVVASVGLGVGCVLIMLNGLNVNISLIATIASFLVAIIWGFDAISTIKPTLQLPSQKEIAVKQVENKEMPEAK